MSGFETVTKEGQIVSRKLTVSPWEYSAIVKMDHDMTDAEFRAWLLEKYPFLAGHEYYKIDVAVDYGNGTKPVVWSTSAPIFVVNLA